MSLNLGEIIEDGTIDFKFTTVDATGLPFALASGALSVYKGNNTTESTAGITLTSPFDSRTGMHHARIVLTDAFYVADEEYDIVITTGTVDGVSVVGYVVAHFSIHNRISKADLVEIVGGTVPTPTTAGVPDVNVERWLDTLVTLSSGVPDVNVLTLATTALNAIAREIGVQKNTAKSDIYVLMVDSTTKAGKTGLTLTTTRSLDAAAFGAITGSTAEVAFGIYQLDASAADMNGDTVIFRFVSAGADDAFLTFDTVL